MKKRGKNFIKMDNTKKMDFIKMDNSGGVSGQSPCKALTAVSGESVSLSKSPSSQCLFWLASRSKRTISRHSNGRSHGRAEKKSTWINFLWYHRCGQCLIFSAPSSLPRSLWREPRRRAAQGRGWICPREAGRLHKEQRQLWQVSDTTPHRLQSETCAAALLRWFIHLLTRALTRVFIYKAVATGT